MSTEREIAYASPNREVYEGILRSVGVIPAKAEPTSKIRSRYGWTWRGIERSEHDRPLGIGGGEVVVFDLQTNEVLAFRRNFRRSVPGTGDVDWTTGRQCLKFENMPLLIKVLRQADPFRNAPVPNPQNKP